MVNIHKQYRRNPVATTDRAGIAQFSSTYFTVTDGVVTLTSGAVSTVSGLTDTNISTPASGHAFIYDGSDSWDNKAISGDCTLAATGAMTVTDLTITSEAQGDLLYFDGSNWVRLAAKTDGQILVGDGTDLASVAVSGDVALTNAGVATVTDLTISSEAQGDILYFDSANWVRLAAGTSGQALLTQGAGANPQWGTPSAGEANEIQSPFTIEGGTYDPSTTVTTQTTSAAALTIPDLGGTAQEWCFTKVAQTLENKTLTAPKIVTTGYIADGGGDELLYFVEDATPVNYIVIENADTGLPARLHAGGSDTNVDLLLYGQLTGNVYVADGTDTTKDLTFEISGATTAKTMTIVSSQTDDRSLTLPDATDTLVGKATTDTLTNKTLTAPIIVTTGYIADAGGDEYLTFVESATPVNYLTVTSSDTGAAPSLTAGGSDANVDLLLHGKATGNVYVADGTDNTKDLTFEISGATTAKTMTIVSSQTDDRSLTLPDATDTLVGKATTDTLTNKTLDCDGTGNVITNVNMAEMDADTIPAADGNNVTIVDGLIMAKVTNNATNFNIYSSNAPYAFMVIDAWSVNISADGGTWKLNDGAAGAGTDITDVVTVAASDTDIDRITTLDDAAAQVAASGSLSIVFDGAGVLDAYIFIRIARLA